MSALGQSLETWHWLGVCLLARIASGDLNRLDIWDLQSWQVGILLKAELGHRLVQPLSYAQMLVHLLLPRLLLRRYCLEHLSYWVVAVRSSNFVR